MEITSADLVTSNLMCIKLKEKTYCEYYRENTAKSFRLVHTRGSYSYEYYISLGLFVIVQAFQECMEIELSLKWHLNKPTAVNFDEDQKNSVPVKEMNDDNTNVYLLYPSDVWTVFGPDQKIFKLKTKQNSFVWKWMATGYICNHKIQYTMNSTGSREGTVCLPCVIWIKFDAPTGEKQSLKVFKDIFVRQTNCDVQFCLDGGKQIGAHAAVLGARSRVFAAMFQNGMIESKSRQVVIKHYKLEFFWEFLNYIYAGRISSELTEIMSQSLWMLADMYEIGELKEECVVFLLSSIRIENAIDLLVWAYVNSVNEVKEGALYFLELNGKDVVESKQWEELTKEHLELSMLAVRRMVRKTSSTSEKEDAFKILEMEREDIDYEEDNMD